MLNLISMLELVSGIEISVVPAFTMFKMSISISKKQLIIPFAIAVISVVGDKKSQDHNNPLVLAICDNVTHTLIGALTWFGVCTTRTLKTDIFFVFEIILCAFCSSLIDIDHFISAKSMNLKDATSLKNRPFLHCTTLAIFIVSFTLFFSCFFKISWLHKFSWILAAAFLSHHIRDSKRRGLWIWPFGHTKPLPHFVHLFVQMFLPEALRWMMNFLLLKIVKNDWKSRIENI